jgi:putative hydrolase of the HAD superfamily
MISRATSTAPVAVTFDFWNTLYSADDGAMTPVRPRRREALHRVLAAGGAHPGDDEFQEAYVSGFDAYMRAWTGGRHFGAHDQVLYFLERFQVDPATLPTGAIAAAVEEIEESLLATELQLLPGARETIPLLAGAGYRLGIISDTSLSPGRILKRFLERDGLLACFSVFTFSDETGYPKPDRRMFASTLRGLGVQPGQAVHVGDIPRTDIAGAKALGMTTIRCAGAGDNAEPPAADFVIRDHREIPDILERLS